VTTIACDGKSMAGDGQRDHCGTIIATDAAKVRKLSDGRILGTSGDVSFGIEFEEWLLTGGEKPKLQGDSAFSAIILHPDGTAEFSGHECVLIPLSLPFAIGSGMDFAIGAMECGRTALEAVQIASKRDAHTGGQITVLFPEQPLKAVA
jgi:ATP-dependent protease HslVU (ClpYQ) peptidase subunit